MSNQQNYIEMIDAYLTGNLSPEDTARLMSSLEQDPALKEEFLLQKDLVHSLQNHRRNELKARLDNIEVGTGYSLPSAASFKIIAGAALVAVLGTGAWFAYDQMKEQPEEATSLPIAGESSLNTPAEKLLEVPENKQEALVIAEEKEDDISLEINPLEESKTETKEEAAEKVIPSVRKPAAEASEKKEPETVAEKAATPAPAAEVVKPEVVTFFEEQDPSASTPEVEVPEDKLKNARKFDTNNIEVTTKTDRRYPFHYMFFDNQLSIYGDFSKVPYEVLEVNTGTQTTYFLYHNGKYYELNPKQQKITRLKELTDERIVRELELTRNQKLQH